MIGRIISGGEGMRIRCFDYVQGRLLLYKECIKSGFGAVVRYCFEDFA